MIDEIGTTTEALAARTIAQRGVQLIATAHGGHLENLMKNPALLDLVGGIERYASIPAAQNIARAHLRGAAAGCNCRCPPTQQRCSLIYRSSLN